LQFNEITTRTEINLKTPSLSSHSAHLRDMNQWRVEMVTVTDGTKALIVVLQG
jgi:hypothetical protein